MKKTTNKDWYDYQKEPSNLIIRAVLLNEGGDFAVEFCRQSGKTEMICGTASFLLTFYYPLCLELNLSSHSIFNIGIFAPQEEQSRTDFDRIKDFLTNAHNCGFNTDFNFETFNSQEIKLRSNIYPTRKVYCYSASPTSNTESKTLHLIICEEAQDLQDFKLNKTILPMGTNTNSSNVYIGTAGYKKCHFFKHVDMLSSDHKIIVPYTRAIKERREMYELTKDEMHLNYEKVIARQDKASDEFKTQYALEWVLERGQFITYEDLNKLINNVYSNYSEWPKTHRVCCGIDWGKVHDSTVVTFVDKYSGGIVEILEYIGDDYAMQAQEIANLIARKYKNAIDEINADGTANQSMENDNLRYYLECLGVNCPVNSIPLTSQNNDKIFKNLARLMLGIKKENPLNDEITIIENPFIKISDFLPVEKREKLFKQFADLQREIKNNLWSCHHPEGATYHDDYCFSLALACMRIGLSDSTSVKNSNMNWNFGVF